MVIHLNSKSWNWGESCDFIWWIHIRNYPMYNYFADATMSPYYLVKEDEDQSDENEAPD